MTSVGGEVFAKVRRHEELSETTVSDLRERADEIQSLVTSAPGTEHSRIIDTPDGLVLLLVGCDERSLVDAGQRFAAWGEANVCGFPSSSQFSGMLLPAFAMVISSGSNGPEKASKR